MSDDWVNGGFGLYIHWPFCQAKCPYCDFNSHVVAQIDQAQWQAAYLAEIDRVGAETKGRTLRSVFFGGGTPSMMNPALVDAILQRVQQTWPLANDIEVTLEANPTSVEADRFVGYRSAGVNRVSLGVQALNDADLKALGRLHTAKEAMDAYDVARTVFDRVSFDLIYARQNQTLQQWEAELENALSLAVGHLSLYQLTIEDGTAFGDRYAAGKLRGLPDDDRAADMFELTQTMCDAAGYPAYEVSNHATPGQESQHNKIYWQYGDYAGIGPGAHGRLTLSNDRYATESYLAPAQWLSHVHHAASGESRRDILTIEEQRAEFLLMGLRVREGVNEARLKSLANEVYNNNINELIDSKLLEKHDGNLCLSTRGRPLLNAILRQLLNV